MAMPIEDLLTVISSALTDMKGKDIVQLDVRGLSNVTDYMVIARAPLIAMSNHWLMKCHSRPNKMVFCLWVSKAK